MHDDQKAGSQDRRARRSGGRSISRMGRAAGWLGGAAVAAALTTEPASATGDRALGEYLSSECAACHQTSGRQVTGIPAIVGYPAEQFIALMEAYRTQQRENQVMRTIAGRLTQDEILALAAYYESLKPTR